MNTFNGNSSQNIPLSGGGEATSPMAKLYLHVLNRLKEKVPELRFIDQDLGQLEHYELRPPVDYPFCLIDLEQFQYTDIGGNCAQEAVGMVNLRIGLVKYTESNNLVPDNIRPNALRYYEVEQKVHEALQGWEGNGFSRLLRRSTATEMRNDDIRVREIKYAVSFQDNTAAATAKRATVKTPRPVINPISGTGTCL